MNTLCRLLVKYQTFETIDHINETVDLFKLNLKDAFIDHITEGQKRELCI